MSTLSKKQVKKAGEQLVANPKDSNAMQILSQWRSLHAYPINTFQALLRKHITKLKLKDSMIAQRLKRTPSIIRKIQRFEGMNLARMQDIGGIRVIVRSVDDVYRLHDSLIKGRHQHEPLLPPKDYISQPKPDGYRSLHQVFKYKATAHSESDGLNIELQIRTKLQHYWATAVETLGLIEKSSFKTGQGSDEYKLFFRLASVLFAYAENQAVIDDFKNTPITDVVQQFTALEQELQAFSKLQGLIITAQHVNAISSKDAFYYLMQLDSNKGEVSITPFSKKQLSIAESIYRLQEIENVDNPHIELVLMSAVNFKDIKKAYPNYFLDTKAFIENLTRICKELH
ncbi:(p)ppGpp synthetase [Moraxella caviae]|uniref:(P)ppGpp synthetase n=2 Tax=Moraxella caviae TaxID=34060 RepID=A0A1T0A3A5_9GAMM|nr:RelA/SpoT domain-containing protein [Moraxella caviae]OOR90197.1 (p)ppGpp synthetase [Moraxella caviae]STZ14585.1 GTP pyrophosphokinase ywaC [Moraxella caviae]VEW11354.1 GTP pyrophosphokinase ywaC [Moraxella caviae]